MPESAVLRTKFLSLLLFLQLLTPAAAQMPRWEKPRPDTSGRALTPAERALERDVQYLSSPLCEGRATGTRGGAEAAFFVLRRLREMGLQTAVQAFPIAASGQTPGRTGHKILAVLPPSALQPRARWVVVCAAYDGLGTIDGRVYPGADSNASGVAALLSLAGRLSALEQRKCGVLLVALDAHQAGRAGADALCSALSSGSGGLTLTESIRLRDVRLLLNLDTVGSILAPVDKAWKHHLIVLGGASFRIQELERYNSGLELKLYDSYYRSRDFTDLFYRRLGDQRPFLERGVPCVMVTSGITDHTNKVSDTPETLHYPVFQRRVEILSRWLSTLLR